MGVTTKDLAAYIGREGWIYFPRTAMAVSVVVTDVRVRFGTVDAEIQPQAGMGSTWVTLDSIKWDS